MQIFQDTNSINALVKQMTPKMAAFVKDAHQNGHTKEAIRKALLAASQRVRSKECNKPVGTIESILAPKMNEQEANAKALAMPVN